MKVLVIEDYRPLLDALTQGLAEEGFTVESADNGEDGLWLARGSAADVIVLDLMLPRLDGLTLLQRLRAEDDRTAVLILTARDGVADRVRGLNLGADDYLVKPFAFDELLARVHALGRRRREQRSPLLRIGPLEMDTAARRVRVAGREVRLSPREYNLLEMLAARPGQVVSRSEIWAGVYEFDSDAASNVVDVYIGYLRRKLGVAAEGLIETVRGYGYRLRGSAGGEAPSEASREISGGASDAASDEVPDAADSAAPSAERGPSDHD